jgi:hypothetical protein
MNISNNSSKSNSIDEECEKIARGYWIVHGWILWVTWSLFGLMMIITARYLK